VQLLTPLLRLADSLERDAAELEFRRTAGWIV